jgi:tetratricopeptide (TPR) repeat protein
MPKLTAPSRFAIRIGSVAAAWTLAASGVLCAPSWAKETATRPAVTNPAPTAPTAPANRNDLTEWLEYQRALGSPSMPAVAQLFYRRGVETLRSGAAEDGVRMLRGACQLDPSFLAPRVALLSFFGTRDISQSLMELARIVDLAKTYFPFQHYLTIQIAYHGALVLFLATLLAALYVAWLRREAVRHAYDEFLRQFLSERMALVSSWALLVIPFVAGMGLALPTLFTLGAAWSSLRKSERAVTLLLLGFLIVIPIGYASLSSLCYPDHPERAPFYGTSDLANAPYSPERLSQLQALVERHPDNPFLHFSTAWMAYRGGEYTLAESEFQEAGKLWPNEPRIPNNLGNLAEIAGRNDEAERMYHMASGLDPSWAMPHYNLGQLYTREFRYAQASEELARAASFDFDLVRNLQAEAQLHPGDPLPPAWGWLPPNAFWDAMLSEPAPEQPLPVPASWRNWLELRGRSILGVTLLCALLGAALGILIRTKLPVRECSNCENAVCRRCAARRRDQVFCADCSASLREASTPEFARLLLARRRRTVRRASARWRTAFSTLLPGLGPVFVDRLGLAWGMLVLGMAGFTGFLGTPGPFPYDARVGPLAAMRLNWGGFAVFCLAVAISLVTYLALRGPDKLREIEPESVKRAVARVPRAA